MITFTRRSLALLPAIAPLLSAEFARALTCIDGFSPVPLLS